MRLPSVVLALLIPAMVLPAAVPKKRSSYLVKSAKQAKAIAEQETGGRATSAQRIPLNGASGGWQVDVRMPQENLGWRCVIDADTRMVHSKTRIDQPGAKGKGKSDGTVRMVKGTR
jgi:hypothetical protein